MDPITLTAVLSTAIEVAFESALAGAISAGTASGTAIAGAALAVGVATQISAGIVESFQNPLNPAWNSYHRSFALALANEFKKEDGTRSAIAFINYTDFAGEHDPLTSLSPITMPAKGSNGAYHNSSGLATGAAGVLRFAFTNTASEKPVFIYLWCNVKQGGTNNWGILICHQEKAPTDDNVVKDWFGDECPSGLAHMNLTGKDAVFEFEWSYASLVADFDGVKVTLTGGNGENQVVNVQVLPGKVVITPQLYLTGPQLPTVPPMYFPQPDAEKRKGTLNTLIATLQTKIKADIKYYNDLNFTDKFESSQMAAQMSQLSARDMVDKVGGIFLKPMENFNKHMVDQVLKKLPSDPTEAQKKDNEQEQLSETIEGIHAARRAREDFFDDIFSHLAVFNLHSDESQTWFFQLPKGDYSVVAIGEVKDDFKVQISYIESEQAPEPLSSFKEQTGVPVPSGDGVAKFGTIHAIMKVDNDGDFGMKVENFGNGDGMMLGLILKRIAVKNDVEAGIVAPVASTTF